MNATSPLTKTARQAQVAAVLTRVRCRSQEELAAALAQRGIKVTQATLSRDLEELGAVRLRGPGGVLVYALPGEPGGPGSRPGGLAPPAAVRTPTPQPGQGPAAVPGGHAPGQAGGHGPAQAAGHGPVQGQGGGHPQAGGHAQPAGGQTPAQAGGHMPAQAGGHMPAQSGGHALTQPGGHGLSQPGGHGPAQASGRTAPGRLRSRVPGTSGAHSPGTSALPRLAAELLVTAEASANLVVLRTLAGGAQLLAGAIDHAEWPSVLGTVAGDDTVLVITRDPTGGDAVARSLLRLAERRAP